MEPPKNSNMVDDLPLLYELIAIALQTDTTRIATLEIGGDFEASRFGYRSGYHGLSHHGQVQESIDALIAIESYQVEQFANFLDRLRSFQSGEQSLLDETMVLFGSGMGNANSHTNTNLPVVLAGGGFRHGQHLAFEKKDHHRPPLANLFVSMLQRFGVETDQFSTSTGTLRDLQLKVMMMVRLACFTALLACANAVASADSALTPTDAAKFLTDYCVDCHGPDEQETHRRFDQLTLGGDSDQDGVMLMRDAVDQLVLGDMPPEEANQPTIQLRQAMIHTLRRSIDRASVQSRSADPANGATAAKSSGISQYDP